MLTSCVILHIILIQARKKAKKEKKKLKKESKKKSKSKEKSTDDESFNNKETETSSSIKDDEVPSSTTSVVWKSFTDAPFTKSVQDALVEAGYSEPSSIQSHAWPVAIISGKDLIGMYYCV